MSATILNEATQPNVCNGRATTDLYGLGVDTAGNIYVAQSGNGPLIEISGGAVSCLAGGAYYQSYGIAADNNGGAYFSADVDLANVVYHTTSNGGVTAIAGDSRYSGCGANANSSTGTVLESPVGLALDTAGNLYIADSGCDVVWEFVHSTGTLTVLAGIPLQPGFTGDGYPAAQSRLNEPTGVAVDPDGNVYIADSGNNEIRMVRKSNGVIETIAGNRTPGHYDDPSEATNSEFNAPTSIAVGPQGNVYIGERGNNDIRQLTLTTVATMISPKPNSVLTNQSTKFTWTSVPNADQYRLTMGSTPGATDYFDDAGSNLTTTSDTVPDVPCDGRPLYVQLITKTDGYWLPAQSYTYSARTGCAAIFSPANGSTLGVVQTFNWNAAPGASEYQLQVTYIDPAGNSVPQTYTTTQTSYTVNNLPCDGKPIYIQLTTVIPGIPTSAGNYMYTACKLVVYMTASPTTLSAAGGNVDLWVVMEGPAPSVGGQLTITESVLPTVCLMNPFTHTFSCPAPVTINSSSQYLDQGQIYVQSFNFDIPPALVNYRYATQYAITASFTVNGVIIDTSTVIVTRL